MTAPYLDPSHGAQGAAWLVEHTCRRAVGGRIAARALAEWARPFELSEPELQVLWRLREAVDNGLDQTTLAERIALSPALLSAIVERLRARCWIVPQVHPGDRRRRLWQLTDEGRAVLIEMLRNVDRLRPQSDEREAAA